MRARRERPRGGRAPPSSVTNSRRFMGNARRSCRLFLRLLLVATSSHNFGNLEFVRLLDGDVARLRTAQNLINVVAGARN